MSQSLEAVDVTAHDTESVPMAKSGSASDEVLVPDAEDACNGKASSTSEGLQHEQEEEKKGGPKFFPCAYIQRYCAVRNVLSDHKVTSVLDGGCAECQSLQTLKQVKSLERIIAVDLDGGLLELNKLRCRPQMSDYVHKRDGELHVSVYQGDITQPDERVMGVDAVSLIEVIEHLEPDVLKRSVENVLGRIHPRVVVMTTPNADFNVLFPRMQGFRHWDHKFEWSRLEFEEWSNEQAETYGYSVSFSGIAQGPEGTEELGCCSQMAVFLRSNGPRDSVQDVGSPYNLVCEADYPSAGKKEVEGGLVAETDYCLRSLVRQIIYEHENSTSEGDQAATVVDYTDTGGAIVHVEVAILHDFSCISELCSDLPEYIEFLKAHGYQLDDKNETILYDYSSESDEEFEDSSDEGDSWDENDGSEYDEQTPGHVESENWESELGPTPVWHTTDLGEDTYWEPFSSHWHQNVPVPAGDEVQDLWGEIPEHVATVGAASEKGEIGSDSPRTGIGCDEGESSMCETKSVDCEKIRAVCNTTMSDSVANSVSFEGTAAGETKQEDSETSGEKPAFSPGVCCHGYWTRYGVTEGQFSDVE